MKSAVLIYNFAEVYNMLLGKIALLRANGSQSDLLKMEYVDIIQRWVLVQLYETHSLPINSPVLNSLTLPQRHELASLFPDIQILFYRWLWVPSLPNTLELDVRVDHQALFLNYT